MLSRGVWGVTEDGVGQVERLRDKDKEAGTVGKMSGFHGIVKMTYSKP